MEKTQIRILIINGSLRGNTGKWRGRRVHGRQRAIRIWSHRVFYKDLALQRQPGYAL